MDALLAAGTPRRQRSAPSRARSTRRRATTAPQADCIMFTRDTEFCRVCRRAIERVIDLYARPAPEPAVRRYHGPT